MSHLVFGLVWEFEPLPWFLTPNRQTTNLERSRKRVTTGVPDRIRTPKFGQLAFGFLTAIQQVDSPFETDPNQPHGSHGPLILRGTKVKFSSAEGLSEVSCALDAIAASSFSHLEHLESAVSFPEIHGSPRGVRVRNAYPLWLWRFHVNLQECNEDGAKQIHMVLSQL